MATGTPPSPPRPQQAADETEQQSRNQPEHEANRPRPDGTARQVMFRDFASI